MPSDENGALGHDVLPPGWLFSTGSADWGVEKDA
jgi:hypothetical protein